VEFVPAIGRRDSAPYFGAVFCRRVIEGEFCRAEIENTQVLCEDICLVGSEICPCFADLEPAPLQAMECGITEPHAPGAHPPPIDLEPVDEEEPDEEQGCWHCDYTRFCTQCDPASPEDEHDADTCPTCGELDAPAPRLRWLARRPSKISLGHKASLFYRLVDAAKVRILKEALRRHRGNRTHAARALGIQRTCLIRLIQTLGVTG
jgi:hypothetical protein